VARFRRLLRRLPALPTGRHDGREKFRARRPQPVNTDGEITTTKPARFHLHRGATGVFVP
jgi:diacylglycerol kinase family enzyme